MLDKCEPQVGQIWKANYSPYSKGKYYFFILDKLNRSVYVVYEIGTANRYEKVIDWMHPMWELVGSGEGTTSNSGVGE